MTGRVNYLLRPWLYICAKNLRLVLFAHFAIPPSSVSFYQPLPRSASDFALAVAPRGTIHTDGMGGYLLSYWWGFARKTKFLGVSPRFLLPPDSVGFRHIPSLSVD